MRLQDVRFKGLLGTGLLGVLLGTSAMVMAQEPAREDSHPQDAKPEEAKPRQQDETKPMREVPSRADEGKPANNGHPQEKQNGEMKPAERNGGEHASQASGRRIPDDRFRSNFGRQHTFRVQTTVVEGQPRFQYSGFWFTLANPWPGDWAYSDDCYIDFIDGEYVLIDLRHPGVMIPVIVVEG